MTRQPFPFLKRKLEQLATSIVSVKGWPDLPLGKSTTYALVKVAHAALVQEQAISQIDQTKAREMVLDSLKELQIVMKSDP